MTLLRYAAESVRHNGRRTFSSVLGVLLAITFVSGTLIAIDSSTRATLDGFLRGLPGDLSFWRNSNSSYNVTGLRNAIAGLAGVENVCLYREQTIWDVTNATPSIPYPRYYGEFMGVDPAHVPSPVSDAPLSGVLDAPNGSAAIGVALADSLGVHLGDSILLRNQVNETVNYTVSLTVVGLLGRVEVSQNYQGPYIGYQPFIDPYWIVVRFQDFSWVLRELHLGVEPYQLVGQVWVNRLSFVNPYDTQASRQNLARLQYRIQSMLFGYGYVTDNVSPVLDLFSSLMAFQRLQYLALSVPVILLGLYLGAIGVDLSHAERRRELAILKTRGASRAQIVRLLLTESVFGGLIAAVLGLAAGILLSRFLLGVVNPFAGISAGPGDFLITRDTVLAIVFLSVALMAAVTFRSARRTGALPVVETLRYYAPGETRTQYSPRLDVVLLSVGILGYLVVLYQSLSPGNLFTFLLGFLLTGLVPILPILIIVGATRLATRSTTRVYEFTSRACKPFAKDLHHIIRSNLARNPRRSSNIAIIIALGLGFGVFTLSFYATSQLNQAEQLRSALGADIVVQQPPYFPRPGDVHGLLRSQIANVSGVQEVTRLSDLTMVNSFLPGVPAYYGGYTNIQFFAVEPDPFFHVTQPASWYFSGGSASEALAALETPGQVLVSQALADRTGLVPGAVIPTFASYWDSARQEGTTLYLNVTVGGIVRGLPGIPWAMSAGFGGFGTPTADIDLVVGSDATFAGYEALAANQSLTTDAFLVQLQPGADWHTVKADILALGTYSVLAYQEQLEAVQNSVGTRSTNGFMGMEVAFIVVILTAGLCLILYAATLERDAEFAAIIARGASGWQTAGLLTGEGFSILLVGLVVGAGLGTLTAFVETDLLYTGLGSSFTPLVPLLFVLPPEAILLLVLAPLAMFVGALIVSVRVARLNVAKVLKMRGG